MFSAIQGGNPVVDEIRLDSDAHNLDLCLSNLIEGFKRVKKILPQEPDAISFAFPGPADYPNGIIGDLPNLPAFRGGVALGPMLHKKFNLPVFINNDERYDMLTVKQLRVFYPQLIAFWKRQEIQNVIKIL